MNINDINLDELQQVDDNFVTSWIQKDLTTGEHFCYLKIDKRNLTETWENNETEMLKVFCRHISLYASRYAYFAFGDELIKKLELRLTNVSKIKELYEKNEDTTWLVYEFKFIYIIKNNDKDECCAFNASFINCLKCDYTPKILAEKVKDVVPELANMKPGDMRSLEIDTLKRVLDTVNAEKQEAPDGH